VRLHARSLQRITPAIMTGTNLEINQVDPVFLSPRSCRRMIQRCGFSVEDNGIGFKRGFSNAREKQPGRGALEKKQDSLLTFELVAVIVNLVTQLQHL
jgi:hypothetical protein